MSPYQFLIRSSDMELIHSLSEIDHPDILSQQLMLKAEIDGAMLLTATVSIISGVGINLFSQWLYDKIKNKPNEKTVINGNQVFAENINIIQITQIIQSPPNSGKNQRKSDTFAQRSHP